MVSTNPLIKLNEKLTALTVEMKAVPLRSVQAAALVVEASVNRAIGHDAPRRRVAGGSVGVTHKTISTGDNAAVLIKATGPLHLLANPTDAHPIDVKHPRTSGRDHAQALRTPYGPKSKVNHPGTKGKDTWHHGVDEALPLVSAVAETAAVTAVRAAFH